MNTPPFKPPLYLRNPHLQTLWQPLFRKGQGLPWLTEQVPTHDGDYVHLSLTQGEKNQPLVFFVHGLEGTINAPMIRGVGGMMMKLGWRVAAINLRGCGVENKNPRLYHAGDAPDVHAALQRIVEIAQPSTIHTIGLSLGGNILVNWLVDYQAKIASGEIPVVSSALISSPHVLAKSVVFTEKALFGLYQKALLRTMKKNLQRKSLQFPDHENAELILKVSKLRDYDEYFTAPQNGFSNAQDYYEKTSSLTKLSQISVPSLYLYAMDDPIVPPSAVPLEWKDHQNPRLKLVLTKYGGHIGWVARRHGRTYYWADLLLEKWLMEQQTDYMSKKAAA
ncbi:MAG: YheT family hydrolase [Sumerlaeia bacterium]